MTGHGAGNGGSRGQRGPRGLAGGLAAVLVAGALLGTAIPAQGVSSGVVVSQVYGGGGNTGAVFAKDYVELFNRGDSPVDLAGYSVQYASATGTGTFAANAPVALGGTLQPGQYHLVALAGGTTGAALPTPDATGSINLSGASGKVVVASTATGLPCNGGSAPCSPTDLAAIVDLVGYGAANFSEGAPAPGLSATTAALRLVGGCQDTDVNATDLVAAAPAPRTTATAPAPCGTAVDTAPTVTATVPVQGGVDVEPGADVVVTFSEPVVTADGWFSLTCSASGAHPAAVAGGQATRTLDPDPDFTPGESCTLTVSAAGVTDQDTDDPPDAMAADVVRTFTVAAALEPVAIRAAQGAGHTSPLTGQTVLLLPAVVTAVAGNGFYLQDPLADADPATSEAIFVFTGSAPSVAVGDVATVRGTVTEFRPGGATSNNLTTTELVSPTVTVASSGNALPSPTVLGAAGRTPPTDVIDDDSFAVFDPAIDGIDFYESLEAMRVQVNDPVATGPTNAFGEVSVVGDGGAGAEPRTSRGGLVVSPGDFNPERIFLDDALVGPTPAVDTGDGFSGAAVGVLDYSFGNYKLLLTASLTGVDRGPVREVTADTGPGEVSIATFNVENLNANDTAEKYAGLADVVVNHLRSPDIIGLEEIQDNNGPGTDPTAVVAADATLDRLVAAISTAGGPAYQWRQINPVAGQDGGQPGGNIRVGFLFRTDRGVEFVDRPGGDSTTAVSVLAGPDGAAQLSVSPGRVDPGNPAWSASRKPLAAEFRVLGEPVIVIVNHFSSKGGDDALFGQRQPPVRSTEVQRLQQAEVLNAFVDSVLAVDPAAQVVTLGDFNDFQFSETLDVLLGRDDPDGPVLGNLVETLPAAEQYTYVFEGNAQVLDHILVSDAARELLTDFDVVHVNAEFAVQTSDHDPSVARFATVSFDGLCALTQAYSAEPPVARGLCAVLAAAEATTRPALRQLLLRGYRLVVQAETGTRPWHAFSPSEGATLQRLSRDL